VTALDRLLNESPLSRAQIIAIALTAVLGAVDGYDVLAMTFAAPGVSREWGLDKATLGLILSSGLIGMAAGSFLISPLADRLGRRPIVLFTLALMAVGMLMTAFSRSPAELVACRIVAGLGIGALVPINTPLAVEYANSARRRFALSIMSIGYPLGGTVGGFGAALLLRHAGWPSVFLLGAAMSLGVLSAAYFLLPEPPGYLLARRPPNALVKLNAYLVRCGHPPVDALPPPPAKPTAAPYAATFARGQWRTTVTTALANLLYLMTVYYVLSWMPKLVADLGHTSAFATFTATLAAACGVVSSLLVGIVGRSVPLRVIAAVNMVGLAVATTAFGVSAYATSVLLGLAAVVGVFLYAGTVSLYGVIVGSFNPDVRTTGVGFAMGVGRIAGAITPALAGFLFSMGAGRPIVSCLIAICALAAAAIVIAGPPGSAHGQAAAL
jgi:MFS family permease